MENKNEHILDKFRIEENKSKKRMFIYSSIPLIITIILILVSYMSVDNANKEVQELNRQKSELQKNITELNKDMVQISDSLLKMNEVMELAVNYKNKRYEFDFGIDKYMHSRYPTQTQLLDEMRALIDAKSIKWHLGGHTIEKGFDSPSFAVYMINKFSTTNVNTSDRYKLRSVLTSTQKPEVGDIVFYEHGYAMFYFEYRNKPFVVGMTPVGLTSLNYDFGVKRLGFAKVEY